MRRTVTSLSRRQYLTAVTAGGLLPTLGSTSRRSPSGKTAPRGESKSSDAQMQSTLPRLHVDGRWLKDPAGNSVDLHGLNTVDPWWGTQYQQMGDATFLETLHRLTDSSGGWHTDVVRVPFQHSIDSIGLERTIEEYVRPVVDFLEARDCYAIIDFHRVEPWNTDEIDREVRRFWDAVAPAFADDEHVLFELFNEPTEPFGDGRRDWAAWRETAQPWVDLVRSHAPETPLLVGSPRWSTYTRYAAEDPFEGENIVYATHLYPTHFENHDLDALAAVADEQPLFVTEWGYVDDEDKPDHMVGSTSGYGEPLRRYFEGIANLSWTAWCADSLWSPTMFDTDGTLRSGDRYMGAFTKRFLADVADRA
jgi:endoglucanase